MFIIISICMIAEGGQSCVVLSATRSDMTMSECLERKDILGREVLAYMQVQSIQPLILQDTMCLKDGEPT